MAVVTRSADSQGLASIFVMVISALGAVGGVFIGYAVDGILENRRLLAIFTAFCGVVLAVVTRRLLAKELPSLFLARHGHEFPRALTISVCVSTLVAGLAAHDLTTAFNVSSGPIIGFASGALSTALMALLMTLYFVKHPDEGVDF